MFVIYEIKNTINSKRYIGSTIDVKARWARHKNELLKEKHHCIHLQRAFNKYSLESFSFSILVVCKSKEEMLAKETELLNSDELLYNTSKYATGGDLISYHPDIESIKEKHRQNYYKNIDPVTGLHKYLNKQDLSGKKNPNYKSRKICDIEL